ncbi:MAG TPA: tetratricopeptide repeat protein [Allosphingosinicella sp.]|nr:tetratricopeptide repeat protein [Allosphingosinicella sp.]
MRRGLLPLALGSVWIAPVALAQDRSGLPPGAVVQPIEDGAGAELRRNLTTLAQNPRSVGALNGAGAAALETGDANAALNFYTRAADADPSSARAKAGMAQALVRLERPSEALPLFTEAARLGAPESELAGDRGLAWDTLGYPARAQADYALSLRREDDPEVRRRLALSLAITGQRAEALRVIEPQLRANDRAGWRTQAFILALTGDAAGAGQTARNMMPGAAEALTPFLQRLAALSPSQKAMAVHFGHFPSDGRAQSFVQADSVADPGALAMAQGNVPMGRSRVRSSRPVSPLEAAAPRRRPGAEDMRLAAQVRPAPTRPSEAAPRRQYSSSSYSDIGAQPTGAGGPPPQQYAAVQPGTGSAPAWPTPVLDERQTQYPSRPPAPQPRPAPNEYQPQNTPQSPGFTLVPQGRPLGRAPETAQPRQPERPLADFSIVTSAVGELEDEAPREAPVFAEPPARQPARTTRAAETRTAQPAPAPSTRRSRQTAAQANPSRVWVQVATGSDRAGLLFTYGQFRSRAPALLNGRAPHAAANRLLVGPFPNETAANGFVRQLNARGVRGYSWTSEAGQRIDQLQAAASNDTRSTNTRTAANERSGAGTRNARGNTGSRSERTGSRGERNASRNERSAGAGGTGRNRNGSAAGSRSGNSRNATASSRGGRSGAANTRTASNSRDRNAASRSGTGSGRSGAANRSGSNSRNAATSASTRVSRGGSSRQQGSSSRRGR